MMGNEKEGQALYEDVLPDCEAIITHAKALLRKGVEHKLRQYARPARAYDVALWFNAMLDQCRTQAVVEEGKKQVLEGALDLGEETSNPRLN